MNFTLILLSTMQVTLPNLSHIAADAICFLLCFLPRFAQSGILQLLQHSQLYVCVCFFVRIYLRQSLQVREIKYTKCKFPFIFCILRLQGTDILEDDPLGNLSITAQV